MFMIKTDDPRPPSPEFLREAHSMAQREIKAGRLVDDGGLLPVAMGAQVQAADGELKVLDGPFVETKEVVGGYAVFELPGKMEAVAAALEFMQLHVDFLPGWNGTCELRQVAASQTRAV